ncbi:hypothetical protein RIR_jg28874.t1 [Rhizophagus irregularis DAOM 181602=DAOM 197198]|nr:hypothetical protein RIR_jg28874.t1 [Rhizophagus irregularis DAOM 181602=DAOM 197198]
MDIGRRLAMRQLKYFYSVTCWKTIVFSSLKRVETIILVQHCGNAPLPVLEDNLKSRQVCVFNNGPNPHLHELCSMWTPLPELCSMWTPLPELCMSTKQCMLTIGEINAFLRILAITSRQLSYAQS